MNELEEISSEEADIFNNIAYACSLNQPKADPDWLYNNQAKRYKNKSQKSNTSSKNNSGKKGPNNQIKSIYNEFKPNFVIYGVNPNFAPAETSNDQKQSLKNNGITIQNILERYKQTDPEEDHQALDSIRDTISPEILMDLEENKLGLSMNYYLNYENDQENVEAPDQLSQRPLSPSKNSFVDNNGNLTVYSPNFGTRLNAEVLVRKPKSDFQRDEYRMEPILVNQNENVTRPRISMEQSSFSKNEGGMSQQRYDSQGPVSMLSRPTAVINHNYNCTNRFDPNSSQHT